MKLFYIFDSQRNRRKREKIKNRSEEDGNR